MADGMDVLLDVYAKAVEDRVRREIAARVRSEHAEPRCCDQHAAMWELRNEIADEIVEGVRTP